MATKYELGQVFKATDALVGFGTGTRKVRHLWVVTDPDRLNAFVDSQEAAETGLAYFPGYTLMTQEEHQQYLQELEKQNR